jgi:citrate synthase
MSAQTEQVISGLEGVLACDSSITFLDGLRDPSVLEYRGYNIHDIAETARFEEIIHLLLEGRLPNAAELDSYDRQLRELREIPGELITLLEMLPSYTHPMAGLRTAISLLACLDPEQEADGREANLQKSRRLAAQFPTVVAAMARVSQELDVIPPDPQLSHAANYLYMLTGRRPDEASTRALDTALNLYAEHELNASTFTLRVITGTLSDLYSAIVGGIAALKGPLHGGAIDEAMRLIMDVGSVENIKPFVDEAFAEKRLLMGFGHRVYKTGDARAVHLRNMCRELAHSTGDSTWYDIATGVEDYVRSQKPLPANVDYYAAPVLYYLGFPLSLFTNFVASSRIVGWCAHALEQYDNNRLIRPRARYVGAREQPYEPVGSRQ